MGRQMVKEMMMGIWVFGLLLLSMNNAGKVNAVSCSEAVTTLNPCLPFLLGTNPSPSFACCSAVEKVKEEATTTQIRRDLCACLKQASRSFGIDTGKAKQLPDLCHVQTPVPIDPNIDCSKIRA